MGAYFLETMANSDSQVNRLRQHRIALDKVLKDERLGPTFRLVAEALQLWLDAKSDDDRQFVRTLMEALWVRKRWRWSDGDGPAETPDALELDTAKQIKSIFEQITKTPEPTGFTREELGPQEPQRTRK